VRPYNSNVRPIVNSFFVFALLSLYVYCNENQNSSGVTFMTTYIPLVIIALLFIALIFNAACIVFHKCRSRQNALTDLSSMNNQSNLGN
jgi:Na+/serine symporter